MPNRHPAPSRTSFKVRPAFFFCVNRESGESLKEGCPTCGAEDIAVGLGCPEGYEGFLAEVSSGVQVGELVISSAAVDSR